MSEEPSVPEKQLMGIHISQLRRMIEQKKWSEARQYLSRLDSLLVFQQERDIGLKASPCHSDKRK